MIHMLCLSINHSTGCPIKIVLIFKFFSDFRIFSVKELEMAVLVIYHAPIKYRLTRGGIFQIGPPWPELRAIENPQKCRTTEKLERLHPRRQTHFYKDL